MFRKTASIFAAAIAACCAFTVNAAGFDGKTLVTNDWFDASFTGLTVDTTIAQDSTTGITPGAGSWTAVPATGTAKIVADEDVGGGATKLAIDAADEELTFTPAALASTTGMETVSVEVNTVSVPTLTDPEGGAQTAFAIYSPDGVAHSLAAYVSDGTSAVWTNFVYASAADLTNAWFTLTLDFATVSNVRYVRYSITPPSGSLTVLADTEGTQWFRSADSTATTVASVSFTGTGDIRTFSGDSLEEVVATYNGVGYGSVADAIAAAAEDGTVTLVKAVTGENIAVSENVTLALGTYNLTASSFTVASGKTLTVTGTGTISAPTITGGGSLAFSDNATLNLTGGTSTLASITAAGDLTVTGNGTVNVTGDVEVDGMLTFTPDAATSEIIAAHPYYTIKVAAATVTANALNGAATIETAGGVTANGGTFYGTICGTGGVTATGSLALQGPSSFSGGLTVSAGTLSLSAYNFNSLVSYDFDASNTNTWEFDETNTDDIKKMKTTVGWRWNFRSTGSEYACLTNDAALFGGKTVMWIPASAMYRYDTDSSSTLKDKRAHTILTVYQKPTLLDSGYLHFYNYQNSSTWDGVRLNTTTWSAHNYTASINDYVYVDGVHARTATADKKSVLSVLSPYATNSNRNDNFGGNGSDGFKGAVAEVIGLNTQASIEQSAAITTYLMHKWDLTDKANYAYLPGAADVQMSSGAVIDLGGTAQTVASLSGSGVVSNGILTVADQISVAVGDTLVIPYGSTYTCAPGTGAMVDETAGTVTLKHNAAEIAVTDPETSAVTTNVYDTVAGAFAAYSEGTLTVHENATLDFGTTEVSISGIELDEGVVLTFTQNAPWTTTISAGVLVNTRMASTYVWTPAENSTDWAALSNWRIGAVTPVALPGANDTVTFPVSDAPDFNCWVVELTSDVYATNVVVNGDMKFSGGQIHTGNVGGIGTITLNGNAGFHTYDMENVNLEVTNNLVIVGTGNRFQTQGSNSYMNGGSIDVLGCVTGNGEITTVGKRSRVRLHGDWSEFTGTVNAQDDGVPRHALRLMAAQASSSNAVYNIYMSNESSGNSAFVETSSGSYTTGDNYHYYFGALNGRITIYQKYNNTLEIGALNQDCAFTGNIAATSRNHIKKVGTATLKFSGSGLGRLEVAGGVFSSATESAIPAEGITFSGSDGFFDPTTNTVDFASKLVNSTTAPIGLLITNNVTIGQIPASNTEGLVKKGEGTLTLAAAPLYAGDTYLDGGTLKIPVGANIKVKTNVEGMSVRRDTTTEEGYTVYKLGKKLPLMIMVF